MLNFISRPNSRCSKPYYIAFIKAMKIPVLPVPALEWTRTLLGFGDLLIRFVLYSCFKLLEIVKTSDASSFSLAGSGSSPSFQLLKVKCVTFWITSSGLSWSEIKRYLFTWCEAWRARCLSFRIWNLGVLIIFIFSLSVGKYYGPHLCFLSSRFLKSSSSPRLLQSETMVVTFCCTTISQKLSRS